MKKIISFLLLVPLLSILCGFYFVNRPRLLCPIKYKEGICIRNDNHGDGLFGASRRGGRVHEGVDLEASVGTPVLASRMGIVKSAKQNHGLGKYVIIKHFGGMTTVYGHLSKILVKKGQFVWRGQAIGCVGKTGNARSRDIQAHLHFEVRKSGVPQDPLIYLQ